MAERDSSPVAFTFRFDEATPIVEQVRCARCAQTAMGYPRETMTRAGAAQPSVRIGKCVACDAEVERGP